MEFSSMCRKIEPDCVIHGGDLFDGPIQSMRELLAMVEAIRHSMTKRFRPWHVLIGNHPWKGKWDEYKDRSALTVLERLNLIFLHPDEYIIRPSTKFLVHTRHVQMVEHEVPWEHVRFKDYDGPGNVFLVSDYHPFQGHKVIKTKKGPVHFVSPGALARTKRIEEDIERQPCAALLTFEGSDIDVKFLYFKCAAPGTEVMNLDDGQQQIREMQRDIDEAVTSLLDLSDNLVVFDVEDVLNIIAKQVDARQEALDLCLRRLRNRSEKRTKS
jgi:DNA repair exonuclease SbcCD nuclease subunit